MSDDKELATAPPAYSPTESLPPPAYDASGIGEEQYQPPIQQSNLYAPPPSSQYQYQPPPSSQQPSQPYYESPQGAAQPPTTTTTSPQPLAHIDVDSTPAPKTTISASTTTTGNTGGLNVSTNSSIKSIGSDLTPFVLPMLINAIILIAFGILNFVFMRNIDTNVCFEQIGRIRFLWAPAITNVLGGLSFIILLIVCGGIACCSYLDKGHETGYKTVVIIYAIVACALGSAGIWAVATIEGDCYPGTSSFVILLLIMIATLVTSISAPIFLCFSMDKRQYLNIFILQWLIVAACIIGLVVLLIVGAGMAGGSRRRH